MGDWRKNLSKRAQYYVNTTKSNTDMDLRMKDYHTVSSDNTGGANPHLSRVNKSKTLKGTHYASKVGMALGATPFVTAAAPIVTAASDAAMGTTVGKALGTALANPITKAVGTSIFGGIGLNNFLGPEGYRKTNKAWAEKRYGDWAKSLGGDILDLSMTAPIFNTAYKGYNTLQLTRNLRKLYKKFEDILGGESGYVNPFIEGTKPVYAMVLSGYGSNPRTVSYINNLLKDYPYIDLLRNLNGTLTLRYFINEPRLKSTIDSYRNFYIDRLGLPKNYTTLLVYDHILQNPKILDLNISNPLGDVVGVTLGYGPKDAILFKHNIDLSSDPEDFIKTMELYNYDKTLPGVYNILKKYVSNGTLLRYHTTTNGGHVGFKYNSPLFKFGVESSNTGNGFISSITLPFNNFRSNLKLIKNLYVEDILKPLREANYNNWLRAHPNSDSLTQFLTLLDYKSVNPKISVNPIKYFLNGDYPLKTLYRALGYADEKNIYINPRALFLKNNYDFARILAHETLHPFQTATLERLPLSLWGD